MEAEMVRAKNKTLVFVKKLGPGGAKGLEGMLRFLVTSGSSGFESLVTENCRRKVNAHGSSVGYISIQCGFALQLDDHMPLLILVYH